MKSPQRDSSAIACFFSKLQSYGLYLAAKQTSPQSEDTDIFSSQITSLTDPDYHLLPAYLSINPEWSAVAMTLCLFACLIQKPGSQAAI